MTKLYVIAAYFFIENTETGIIITDHRNNVIFTPTEKDDEFIIESPSLGRLPYQLADLVDFTDVAFTSVTIQTFFTTSSGLIPTGTERNELISLDQFYGRIHFDKSGRTLDLMAGSNKGTIWQGPTADYNGFIDVAGQLEIVSDDAADNISGIGAQKSHSVPVAGWR